MKQRYFICTGQVTTIVESDFLESLSPTTQILLPFQLDIVTDGIYPPKKRCIESIINGVNSQKQFIEMNITIEAKDVCILNIIELSEEDYKSWEA